MAAAAQLCAQTQPLGQLTNITMSNSCTGMGWFTSAGFTTTCETADVVCPNTATAGFTFAYTSPQAVPNGVVIFFNGGDGTMPYGDATGTPAAPLTMAQLYFSAGYEVVQLAWNAAWQGTNQGQLGILYPGNIQAAACRPATFINWIYNNVYLPITQGIHGNPSAGMCAQGASAGSAQIAYSMAYYGAGAWLDNVELISGPVLSDIAQGCQNPAPPDITMCPNNGTQAQQWGCPAPNQGGASWTLSPTYLGAYANGVGNWTYDTSCASPNGTTQQSDLRWLAMSIVDQPGTSGGVTPTFSYPTTAMSGWICRSLKDQASAHTCQTDYGQNQNYCPNNSSSEGEIFYQLFTSINTPPHYALYPVDTCSGPEGVVDSMSNVPGFYYSSFAGTINGINAVSYDMVGYSNPPISIPKQCFHGPHKQ